MRRTPSSAILVVFCFYIYPSGHGAQSGRRGGGGNYLKWKAVFVEWEPRQKEKEGGRKGGKDMLGELFLPRMNTNGFPWEANLCKDTTAMQVGVVMYVELHDVNYPRPSNHARIIT